MKAVILAGGFGTRLSEYTETIPKPMVTIGDVPILIHIMSLYSKYNINEFIIATGYKSKMIDDFFTQNSHKLSNDTDETKVFEFNHSIMKSNNNCKVTTCFTGQDTMTGGRLLRLKNIIGEENFLLTYGDGLSNVNIESLIKFHKKEKKIATLTAVRPPVRFGELEINGNQVLKFEEKPKMQKGWINGGFFVLNKKIFDFIQGDDIMLEREPLENCVVSGELNAFKHEDFWFCMDTKRDKDNLEKIWASGNAPWID